MAQQAGARKANHYVFAGPDVSGVINTSSITGQPTGAVTVDGIEVSALVVSQQPWGWVGDSTLDALPDAHVRTVTVIVPEVNLAEDEEPFEGLVVIITHRTSIGGPDLVVGALQWYSTRLVSGTASEVEFLASA